jgi:hypothetical protein
MGSEFRGQATEAFDDGRWLFRKVFGWALFVLILLGAAGFVIHMGSRPAQVVETITDPDRMIQTREWFKQTYEDISALPAQIATAEGALADFQKQAGPRSEWTYQDKQEASQLHQTVTALRLHRQQLVAEYNAKAKSETRAFLAWGMPKEVQ